MSNTAQDTDRTGPRSPATKPAAQTGSDDPRVMATVRYFRVVVRAIQAHSAWVERQCGVSAAQLWALWEIARDPGLKVSTIARRLSIKPATASNLLDKIEHKGLLKRERLGPDQRVVQLFITEAGRNLLDSSPAPAQGALLDALTRLETGQLDELHRSLETLVDILHIKDESSALAPMPPANS